MKTQTLRLTIIGLLMFTGVFHLAVAFLNAAPGLGWPIAGFGLVYTVVGFYVRRDTNDGSKSHSRNAVIAAIAACSAGLALGGNHYIANGGPGALVPMFIIDVAIITAAVMWLVQNRAQAKTRR